MAITSNAIWWLRQTPEERQTMSDAVNTSYTPEKLARSHRLADVNTPTSSTLPVGRLRLQKNGLSVCYWVAAFSLSLASCLPLILSFFSFPLWKDPRKNWKIYKNQFKNTCHFLLINIHELLSHFYFLAHTWLILLNWLACLWLTLSMLFRTRIE